ncbi:hypothetical protein NLJ89_g5298 [Agrocybe chaxingu]|uniref:Uncharacterized protein n=1 Tax=Agrocybe chaxingu TaxID=84603 RepID=A0A9W8K7H1_9AGAR|nr:hypothetical protein NLJ89_g5298 [Agrocybe chaxingu]
MAVTEAPTTPRSQREEGGRIRSRPPLSQQALTGSSLPNSPSGPKQVSGDEDGKDIDVEKADTGKGRSPSKASRSIQKKEPEFYEVDIRPWSKEEVYEGAMSAFDDEDFANYISNHFEGQKSQIHPPQRFAMARAPPKSDRTAISLPLLHALALAFPLQELTRMGFIIARKRGGELTILMTDRCKDVIYSRTMHRRKGYVPWRPRTNRKHAVDDDLIPETSSALTADGSQLTYFNKALSPPPSPMKLCNDEDAVQFGFNEPGQVKYEEIEMSVDTDKPNSNGEDFPFYDRVFNGKDSTTVEDDILALI